MKRFGLSIFPIIRNRFYREAAGFAVTLNKPCRLTEACCGRLALKFVRSAIGCGVIPALISGCMAGKAGTLLKPNELPAAAVSLPGEKSINVSTVGICSAGVADSRQTIIKKLAKPEPGVRYIDPALGATVVRISSSNVGEVRKPAYSTMQAWNADESLLLLYVSSSAYTGHELRDGHSYELIRRLNIRPSDIEEVFWSHSQPDELYFVSAGASDFGQFKKLNVNTDESVVIADFTRWCGSSLPVAGSDVHMQSYNDDWFGFRCRADNDQPVIFSYRVSTDEVTVQAVGEGTPWEARTAPVPTPTGQLFWFQGAVLDQELLPLSVKPDMKSSIEHSSLGQTAAGQAALYQVAFGSSPRGCSGDPDKGVGHLVQHNLVSGECRNIIGQQSGYPYPTSSTHMSALSVAHPGRVAMSSIGSMPQMRYLAGNRLAPPLLSEIYLAETAGSEPVICRLAHHRSFGKNALNGGYEPYFGEPHATLSPSGTRILFGSDWYDSGSVDSYVVELPGYSQP